MSARLALAVCAALAAALPARAQTLPAGFVNFDASSAPVRLDIRYAGTDNFTGRRVPGYESAQCWLRADAASALAGVATDLARQGWRLVIYDCYRPQRAVNAFLAWAQDATEQSRRAEFYPNVDKRLLIAQGYIAKVSSHSRGLAVDAGAELADGSPLDFGTPWDRFDPRSATENAAVGAQALAHRRSLRAAFQAHGYANYTKEWWHFGYARGGAAPASDLPIR